MREDRDLATAPRREDHRVADHARVVQPAHRSASPRRPVPGFREAVRRFIETANRRIATRLFNWACGNASRLNGGAALGESIVAASKGEQFGPQPEWWSEFEEQYEALQVRDKIATASQDVMSNS